MWYAEARLVRASIIHKNSSPVLTQKRRDLKELKGHMHIKRY